MVVQSWLNGEGLDILWKEGSHDLATFIAIYPIFFFHFSIVTLKVNPELPFRFSIGSHLDVQSFIIRIDDDDKGIIDTVEIHDSL